MKSKPVSELRSRLLSDLFPRTAFYTVLFHGGRPPWPTFIAVSGDSIVGTPNGFNLLLREYNVKVNERTMVKLAKAFVIVAVADERTYWESTGDPGWLVSFPKISSFNARRTGSYDRRQPEQICVEVECVMGNGEVRKWEFYDSRHYQGNGVWTRTGQFGVVRPFVDGKPSYEYQLLQASE